MPATTGFTLVAATKIQDASGRKLASGRVTFFPVNNLGKPISAIAGGGGGLITQSGVVFLVVDGVITTDLFGGAPQIADTALTTPTYISYRISVTDESGAEVQGPGYGQQQPTGTSFSLDTAIPNQPQQATVQAGPAGAGFEQITIAHTYTTDRTFTFVHNLNSLGPLITPVSTAGSAAISITNVTINSVDITVPGPCSLTITFSALPTKLGTTTVLTIVSLISTTVVLTMPLKTITPGQSLTLTSTTTPTAATGTAAFLDGSSSLGSGTLTSGVATLTTAAITARGIHSLTSSYSGDGTYSGGVSAADVLLVLPAPANQWLMGEGTGTSFGDPIGSDPMALTAVAWTAKAGFPGLPATFNGTSSKALASGTSTTSYNGTAPFSLSIWALLTSYGVTQCDLFSNINGPTTFQGLCLAILTGGIQFQLINTVSGSVNAAIVATNTTPFSLNAVHHVVVTYDGSKTAAGIKIYCDGSLVAVTSSFDTLTGSTASPNPLCIGADAVAGSFFTPGVLADARNYAYALTAAEIAQMFANGIAG